MDERSEMAAAFELLAEKRKAADCMADGAVLMTAQEMEVIRNGLERAVDYQAPISFNPATNRAEVKGK
jgi:hypothetical protein